MSEGINHWAEKLEMGDRCLATIRHKKGGEKNIHNAKVIVVSNNYSKKEIVGWFESKEVKIPYNELTQWDG
jgi:hypothetical protein